MKALKIFWFFTKVCLCFKNVERRWDVYELLYFFETSTLLRCWACTWRQFQMLVLLCQELESIVRLSRKKSYSQMLCIRQKKTFLGKRHLRIICQLRFLEHFELISLNETEKW